MNKDGHASLSFLLKDETFNLKKDGKGGAANGDTHEPSGLSINCFGLSEPTDNEGSENLDKKEEDKADAKDKCVLLPNDLKDALVILLAQAIT